MFHLSPRIHSRRSLLCLLLFACCGIGFATAEEINFTQQIAPILKQHCFQCHGEEKQKGGLRFDHKAPAFAKADSGELAIIAGKPTESELLKRINSSDDDTRMPPKGERLSSEQIALITRWIEAGAAWPDDTKPAARSEMIVTEADRQHWSFRPLQATTVPNIATPDAAKTEIDCFIIAALEKKLLTLAPTASPRKLVRRIYFDLIGLPPSPVEVEAFETAAKNDLHQATAELVDRLLASRHYGERWGRHWLDVARYADSNGQEGDQDRPFAYQYRDMVIRALNDDLPFDTFVRWQIAGDELEPENAAAVAATGFLVAGPSTILDVPMEEEKIRNRYNELDDTLATLGSAMLGLTLGCARCHDHKFDAIPTRDYYRLLAAIHSGERREVPLGTSAEKQAFEKSQREWSEKLKVAEQQWKDWSTPHRMRLEPELRQPKIAALSISDDEKKLLMDSPTSDEAKKLAKKHEKALTISDDELKQALPEHERRHWDELQSQLAVVKKAEPAALPKAYTFRDFTAEAKTTWLFHRADFYDKSEPVQLGFLTVLTSAKSPHDFWEAAKQDRKLGDSTYQRTALANWITNLDQGAGALLARVMVNRVWQHHFGEGLVRTPSDFGVQGEPPTHPELLERLTHDFVSHGWKLKRLHRQIMLSAVYLQDSAYDATKAKIDPDNRWLSRRRPQRLEAEILRDSLLKTAGSINLEPFGPGFKPPVAAEAMTARNLKTPYNAEAGDSPNLRRRSVYMFHKRVVPYPLLQAFDRPESLQSCARRDNTTVAPQALALLNDAFVRERAKELANRVLQNPDASSRVTQIYRIAFGRAPSESEAKLATEFISQRIAERMKLEAKLSETEAAQLVWTDLSQVMFSLNEFLYVD